MALPIAANAAATIVIVNGNAPGVGFNDATPVAPVGGNVGTTLGQQRLIAFQEAANIWGATLNSNVTISVLATMEPLTCTSSSAVLGSAGPLSVWRDFAGVPMPAHWYHGAIADKLFGADLDPGQPDIRARFNSNLGQPNCLAGSPFYLGLDTNHGTAIDLVTVLLHEFGHGLGFSNVTNGSTGAQLAGFPSMWDPFLYDLSLNKNWEQMTQAERQSSGINGRKVVWTGNNVTALTPSVLTLGTPRLAVTAPANLLGDYLVGAASYGPAIAAPGVSGTVMPISTDGCAPLSAANALAVKNNIALIDRGVCGFTIKVKNAQDAGAIGVIIADNVAGTPPAGLGGADPSITIPSARITLADATLLRTALKTRSRTSSALKVNLGVNPNQLAGADTAGRVMMFTPSPYQSGSSVSHWDTSATRNLLMEPSINGDLTHSVNAPEDLSKALLTDLGW
ncbi:peptidase [Permianibacter sp. IMCC34836]|nr:peptidase [Permianibacter fluminis]